MKKKWRKYPMRKPVQPEDEACCGGGCDPCVFDSYYKMCEQYKLYLQFLKEEEELTGQKLHSELSEETSEKSSKTLVEPTKSSSSKEVSKESMEDILYQAKAISDAVGNVQKISEPGNETEAAPKIVSKD